MRLTIAGEALYGLRRLMHRAARVMRRLARTLGVRRSVEPLSYAQWCRLAEPSEADLDALRVQDDRRIAFSIVMPVFNPDLQHLQAAIDSVVKQTHARWTLCICNDGSNAEGVAAFLDQKARTDSRIRVCHRAVNGGIAAASADALALADADFIALLDQDDVLAPWALTVAAEVLEHRPDADLLYSDEDKIADGERRFSPHFKPDWNPELFHAINYFGHFLVLRRALIEVAGGFRLGFDGSQDYDLALRCVALTEAERIVHIPAVLYHWRATSGSTAATAAAKPYAHQAGIRALRDRFAGIVEVAVEDGPFPTSYRVRYPLPRSLPRISIMIPTRDGAHLARCVESLRKRSTYRDYEVLLLNNQSQSPQTLAYFSKLQQHASNVRVLDYDKPFNFSAINNFGAAHADGDVLILLNDDIEVMTPDWMEEMLSFLSQPGVGAVGAKLYYPDGRIQHAGIMLGIGGVAGHAHKYYSRRHTGYFGRLVLPQAVSAVTGACLMVRKNLYQRVGGLDERHLAVAFNDVDFCLRLALQGLRCVWTPYAEMIHHESASRGAEDTPAKHERFMGEIAYMKRRWGGALEQDSYYSPNLTLQHEDFSLRELPEPYIRRLQRYGREVKRA